MKEISLPARTLLFWRLRLCAIGAPACLTAAYLCLYSVYFTAAAGILSAAVLFLCFFYLPRLHRGYKIVLGAEYILVRRGVFIETERIIAKRQILLAKTTQTPLCRALSLSKTELRAVRTRVSIPPLDNVAAVEISNFSGGDAFCRK